MIDNLLCGGFSLVVALALLTLYRRSYRQGYWDAENDPLFLSDDLEYRCVIEQRKSGRERGGPVYFTKKVEEKDDYKN